MKINRLMEIIIILLNRDSVTSRELSERFNVSQRTIYRDIDELSSAGIPVYMNKGKGGGISLLENYTLNKTILSDEEKKNIVFAVKTLGATKQLQMDNTLEKLGSVFGNINSVDWVEVDFTHWGSNKEIDTRFQEIKTSILKQKIVTFQYVNSRNIKSNRYVKPYKIIFKGQAWYLLGYCCEKKAMRVFKITRMRNVKITDEQFERREISKFFKDTEDNYEFSMVELKLRFKSNMLYRIIDFYDENEILEEADGNYIVTTQFPYDEWIYSHILSYGDRVEVIEPEFIREEVKARLKNILKTYI
ncbi:MAG: YafY family protein [Clostridium sp.]|nr:YafY family protein [Clostridium sp.]